MLREKEVLVFRHPRAGVQFVKGKIEKNETPQEAALRELAEESGIRKARIERDLGVWDARFKQQLWSFHVCAVNEPLEDRWVHRTADGGGQDFRFFWHPLDRHGDDDWHSVSQRALGFVRERVESSADFPR